MGCRTSSAKSAIITANCQPTLTQEQIPARASPFGPLVNKVGFNDTQDKKEVVSPNPFGALLAVSKSPKGKDHTRDISMNAIGLEKSKVEEEISALLVSHGIESSKSDELAKKILELPSMNNIGSPVVDSTPKEDEQKKRDSRKKLTEIFGGSQAFQNFGIGLAKTTHTLDLISNAIRDKNKSTATQIIEKLDKLRPDIPDTCIIELDWCITQIRAGNIYKDTNIVSIIEQLTEDQQENVVSHLRHFSLLGEKSIEEKDDITVHQNHEQRKARQYEKREMFKRQRMLTKEICDVGSIDLDIFQLEEQHGQVGALVIVAANVFGEHSFFDDFNINRNTFDKCIVNLGMGYLDSNPYHNALHAADVLQMCNLFLRQTKIMETAELEGIHILSYLMSAVIHDIGHPGFNNAFMVAGNDPLAIQYNDKSVLENFHVAEGFRIITQEENNVLAGMEPEEYRTIRRLMITCVLGTDMAKHGKQVAMTSSKLEKPQEDRAFVITLLLHAADISHATRPFELTLKWSIRVQSEFFAQGDREKDQGNPVTFICDRENLDVCKSQVGFISGVILPFFMIMSEKMPGIENMVTSVKANRDKWQQMAEDKEEINIP